MYKIDKDVHYLEMNIEKFNRKWLLYANIVDWMYFRVTLKIPWVWKKDIYNNETSLFRKCELS